MTETSARTGTEDLALSLVRGDLLFRLQRRIGLIPKEGLGIGRRAIFYALLAWLPIAVWALLHGRAVEGALDEPVLQHFGVHVRCLIAIPLLVIAEGMAHALTLRLLPQFVAAGLVPESQHDRFVAVVASVIRLRDSTLPWIVIAGVVLAWTTFSTVKPDVHELAWAAEHEPAAMHLRFGGWWFLFVARPIYVALLLAWMWRLILLLVLFRRISKIGLSLVPTHPDRVGGLGFLESMPTAFSLVVLAMSSVTASHWAHQVLYHDATLASLRVPAVAFLIVITLLFLAPLLIFAPPLAGARKRALLEYAALVARHGRLVRRRWIEHKTVTDDAVLSAPELGPVADTIALYEAVEHMRPVPIGRSAVMAILVPALLPMIVVVALRVPIGELLLKILKTLA